MFAFMVSGATSLALGSLIPFLRSTYNLSYEFAGMLVSLQSVGNLVSVGLMGFLPVFLGRRKSVLIMAVWMAVSYLMFTTGWGGAALLPILCFAMGVTKGGNANFANTMMSTLPGQKAGIGYNLAGSNPNTGIHFDINDLPKEDFTVEIVANARGYTVNAAGKIPVTTTGLYGIGVEGCFAFGPLKGYGFPAEREPDYSKYTYEALVNGQVVTKTVTEADIKNNATYLDVNGVEKAVSSVYNYLSGNLYAYNELRWYYSEAGLTWHTTFAKYGAYGLIWENTWRNNYSAKAVTIKHDLVGGNSPEYAFYCDGAPAASLKMPGSGNSKAPYIPVEEGMEFVLFRDMPATVYAVRVYDRVLSTKEQAQNHFVDIASYYGLNLKNFKKLTDDQKESVYEIFATADFTSKKADIESLLESATTTSEPFNPAESLCKEGTHMHGTARVSPRLEWETVCPPLLQARAVQGQNGQGDLKGAIREVVRDSQHVRLSHRHDTECFMSP